MSQLPVNLKSSPEKEHNGFQPEDRDEGEASDESEVEITIGNTNSSGIPIIEDPREVWHLPGSSLLLLVPSDIHTKIRDNKYFELDKLHGICEGYKKDYDEDLTLTKSNHNDMVVKAKTAEKIFNIYQYMQAFFVFSVVCSHYWLSEGSQLFQYLFEILDIHSQGGNFLNYDRQFRMIRESTHRPWDRPLESFYVKSILRKDSQTPNTNNSNNKRFHITSRFGGRSSATNIDDHSLIKGPP